MADSNDIPGGAARQPVQCLAVAGDGVRLAAFRWGHADAPVLLLVHGYPDNHTIWLPLIDALADEFQIIAYDVRGFGASQTPRRLRDYRLERLANDLEAVIRATCPGRPVHLLGHDWGSIQCWEAVTEPRLQPLLASYTSISGPCLDHVGQWMRERLGQKRASAWRQLGGQLLSSWYIVFFHLPLLPELCWRLGLDRAWPWLLYRVEGLRNMPRNASQRADGIHGVALYRANFIRRLFRPCVRHTGLPVQLIVPLRDRFVRPQLFDDLFRWAPNLTRHESAAGHWQLLARPRELAERMRRFIAQQEEAKPLAAPTDHAPQSS
ncbi:MAG TPA: alpha/beta fold hydrolase [Pseudomonas sp.]|uniref:alpha/beta fold hydrolase n=1 Tax=Pseudomonas sp. TaxID=306 RepID=UPI002CAA4152|nr:alpha/beta fold hydrolase [Pseudomonas sp.]HTO18125.1 alpha/beta fold hydrolase [Pseudomonas sp.]